MCVNLNLVLIQIFISIFDIGSPAHILHNGIHRGVDQFKMFDIESLTN